MKNYLFLLLSFLLIFSCNNDDDDNGNGDDNGTTQNYFPIHDNNYWDYEGSAVASTNTHFDGQETFNGEVFKQLKNQGPVFGFEGNSFVSKQGNDYFLYSNITLDGIGTIAIENKKFLDEGTAVGGEINNFTLDKTLEVIPFNQNGITASASPIVHYNTSIKYVQHYDSHTLNGSAVYEDVMKVIWTFRMSADLQITGTGPNGVGNINLTHNLISEGQVGTLTQYFANNKGVARSEFHMDYSGLQFNNNITTPFGNFDISNETAPLQTQLSQAIYNNVSELTSSYNVVQ